MTSTELKTHPTVETLIRIQSETGLKDIPFAKHLRLGLHGANWGKIKSGTYTGSHSKALLNLEVAVDAWRNPGAAETEEGIVILSHVRETMDAFSIADGADEGDEHRLVILAGPRGSGKTRTLRLLNHRKPGHYLEALPSWGGSYYDFLTQFAAGIGATPSGSSKGALEASILAAMISNPAPIYIDEFNYFSPSAINFVKSLLNRVSAPIVTATLPKFLANMAAESRTAQESAQLVRRSVAIIHIGNVTERDVLQIQAALFPGLLVSAEMSKAIAESANRGSRLDSVVAILDDADGAADIGKSIARHERAKKTILHPSLS